MKNINGVDDGHSPDTCTYRACNAPNPKGPCPFTADKLARIYVPVDIPPRPMRSKHEHQHQHQHTIPVEWAGGSVRTYVTRLRCPCGDEIARDYNNTI